MKTFQFILLRFPNYSASLSTSFFVSSHNLHGRTNTFTTIAFSMPIHKMFSIVWQTFSYLKTRAWHTYIYAHTCFARQLNATEMHFLVPLFWPFVVLLCIHSFPVSFAYSLCSFLEQWHIHLNYFLPAMSATLKLVHPDAQKKETLLYINRSLKPFRLLIYKQHMCAWCDMSRKAQLLLSPESAQ